MTEILFAITIGTGFFVLKGRKDLRKYVCFSDTHGKHRQITDWLVEQAGDGENTLVCAGDYTFSHTDFGIDFISWFHSLPYKRKILTFGNHDSNYSLVTTEVLLHYDDIIILNHKPAYLDGVKWFGTPYSLRFFDWEFMEDEDRLAQLYRQIPDDTEILVTHSPPKGILDTTLRKNRAGSEALLDRINELPDLKYVICGHIHEARGVETVNGVTYLNAGIYDSRKKELNEPLSFTF